MSRLAQILLPELEKEYSALRATFKPESYYGIHIMIRRIDMIKSFFHNSELLNEDEIAQFRNYYDFGWAPIMKKFYEGYDFGKKQRFIQTSKVDNNWADSVIVRSGILAVCKQLLDYEKAGLVKFEFVNSKTVKVIYQHDSVGDAYFEKLSADFYIQEVLQRSTDKRMQESPLSDDQIRRKLVSIIQNPKGKFISYKTTAEIDDYYNEVAKHYIWGMQGIDSFGPDDKFGGIEYWKYLDFVKSVVGVAIMHGDACVELIRQNPKVEMQNIISYMDMKENVIETYSSYLGAKKEEIEQILSCLTLSEDNYSYYLDIPGAAQPLFYQVSDSQIIRSVSGATGNPIRMLNRELKRRFRSDYDLAVNNREDRFRADLFRFFPQDHITKIPRGVNITVNNSKTDIDAIIFDSKTGTLGLFQLKWQDLYVHNMKERYSRMSNMFPKSEEWIGKVIDWVSSNNDKSILNSLQIEFDPNNTSGIQNICVFILSRNQVHFTEYSQDERVAWGSWYQIIESQAKVETRFEDPIMEMFMRLKVFNPENRKVTEKIPERQEFDFLIGDIRVFYSNEQE